MENKEKNILWVDIAKFSGIFLVIISHVIGNLGLLKTGIFEYINTFCNLFYMPLFFVVAGFLYKDKGLKNNYNKIIWALIIPYLIYQFAFLPFVLGNNVLFHNLPIINTLKKCLIGILLGDVEEYASLFIGVCCPCWFIMSMIQLRILFAHIKMDLQTLLLFATAAIIITKLLVIFHIDLYFCLDNTLMAIPYFIFGYLLKNYFCINIEKIDLHLRMLSIMLSILILCLILRINSFIIYARVTTNIQNNQSLLLIFLAGIIGSLMVIFFSTLFIKANDFVITIAKNTLFIIYFHFQLLFFVKWIGLETILHCSRNTQLINLLLVLFLTIMNLIINYYLIKFLERHCPLILGKGLKNGLSK